jgi:hypothetical protein
VVPAGNGYTAYTVIYCETSSSGNHFKLDYVIGSTTTSEEVKRQDDGIDGGIAGNRIPDLVDQVAAELEDAYDFYANTLGFAEPISGPDQITVGLEAAGPSGNLASKDALGFGGIKLYLDPADGRLFPYSIPHELLHGFEYGYRDTWWDTGYFERDFWYEATANWGAHKYVDFRRLVDPAFAPNNEWTGDIGAYFSTTQSELSAESLNNEQRQYAVGILAEYLEERFPSAKPVRRTWELIEAGQTAKQAIANAVAEQPGSSFDSLFEDYAQAAYQMSLNDPDLPAWIAALENYTIRHPYGDLLYVGPDDFGNDRPLRHLGFTTPSAATTGELDLGEEGMGYVDIDSDLVLGGQNGELSVRVQRPDDNVQARLVVYQFVDPNDPYQGTLPCSSSDVAFSGGEGSATLSLNGPCRIATLVIVRSGPPSFSLFGSTVKWSASASASQG